ncbi:MAG: hypothetical protein ACR2NJ_06760 [Acidimicrobiales bacterium]
MTPMVPAVVAERSAPAERRGMPDGRAISGYSDMSELLRLLGRIGGNFPDMSE